MSWLKKLFPSNNSEKDFGTKLFQALYTPNKQKVIDLIDNQKIDINEYLDSSDSNSMLINAVNCSSDYHSSKEQIELVDYLINQKADVNWKNDNGFNALHMALAYHTLSKVSILLIKKGKADINMVEDKNGNSPIFTAIREYGLTWREEQKEVNQLRFEIVEELLNRGADLDKVNKHGITARKWLESLSEDDRLHQLIEEYDHK